MEHVIGLKAPGRRKRKAAQSKAVVNTACRCGVPLPSAASWYEFIFKDKARLQVSIEQFWQAGNCPVAALNRLICDFSLSPEKGAIYAPFPFSSNGDPARVCQFLQAVMDLSIRDYSLRISCAGGGSC
jgi:hypothetical protein